MSLLRLMDVSFAYGQDVLLDQVNLTIDFGERIALLGRNGAGKSTLMRIIGSLHTADSGTINQSPDIKIAMLSQSLPDDKNLTVEAYIFQAFDQVGILLNKYHALIAQNDTQNDMIEIARLQEQIDYHQGWVLDHRVESVLSALKLNGHDLISDLSGGWKRRVALARALVVEPDLLILDEPTNHLDIPAIIWLEDWLKRYQGSVLFTCHDRQFVTRVANRILELDRGHLLRFDCDFATYQKRKAQQLEVEQIQNREFDKKLAKEEKWLRQGVKARRTRNEGRVRDLMELRQKRQARKEQLGLTKMTTDQATISSKMVFEAKNLGYRYDDHWVLKEVNLNIQRGDKVGLIGVNGSGKSTLIKLLLKQLDPTCGQVRMGLNLKLGYLDQLRDNINLEETVLENVALGRDYITTSTGEKHIIGYLGDFLFSPSRCQVKAGKLSGGELNRLMMAQVFSKPINLLVLDEPTNDLDAETLELLEYLLVEFKGTILLVSHDRMFLNNVIASSLVFYPNAQVKEYIGGFDDWLQQSGDNVQSLLIEQDEKQPVLKVAEQKKVNSSIQTTTAVNKKKKLSFNLQRELTELPQQIEQLEQQKYNLELKINAPEFYQNNQEFIHEHLTQLKKINEMLDEKTERWLWLESQN